MREGSPWTLLQGLILCLALIAGPGLWGCLPLPVADSKGVLKSAALDPSGRIHVVTDGYNGIHYGVINTLFMTPELVTSEGTLGGIYWYPWGAGRGVLALGPDGSPHVLYYSNVATSIPYLYGELIHAWKESGVWESEVIGTVGGDYEFSSHPSIAIDGSGDVHVGYADVNFAIEKAEIRYARKHDGTLTEEVIGAVVVPDGSYTVLVCRIGLGPDREPVVAVGLGGADLTGEGSNNVIYVAQPAMGGGWEVEEIFTCPGPACSVSSGGAIKDLSLAVGPSGEKAVGFRVSGYEWARLYVDYQVMVDEGSGWETDEMCNVYCDEHSYCDCQAQDIAYDPAGQLYSMFTRVWFASPYPDIVLKQSIVLAHRTETGWPEETLWDNTLYDVAVDYAHPPHLLFARPSEAKIVYQGPTLMHMGE